MKLRLAMTAAVGAALLTLGASAQSQTTGPATSVAAPVDERILDVIFARSVLMDQVDLFMSEIEALVEIAVRDNVRVDVEAAEFADTIAILLQNFPHLFPEGSYVWSPQAEYDDPTKVTQALPNLWENYDAFYALAQFASQQALELSQMFPRDRRFVAAAAELRNTCNACHAEFTRWGQREAANAAAAMPAGVATP